MIRWARIILLRLVAGGICPLVFGTGVSYVEVHFNSRRSHRLYRLGMGVLSAWDQISVLPDAEREDAVWLLLSLERHALVDIAAAGGMLGGVHQQRPNPRPPRPAYDPAAPLTEGRSMEASKK